MERKDKKKKLSHRIKRWRMRLPLGWRIVGVVLMLMGVLLLAEAVWLVVGRVSWHVERNKGYRDFDMGNGCAYWRSNAYGIGGWIRDNESDKRYVRGVDWVSGSRYDSLWVVASGGRRSFFNTAQRQLIAPMQYKHAWEFSEGVAAVVDSTDRLRFIDRQARPAFEACFTYNVAVEPYVFRNGLCSVADTSKLVGLIDHQGAWVVPPQYIDIDFTNGYWLLQSADTMMSVLDSTGAVVVSDVPGLEVRFADSGDRFEVWHPTRPGRLYDMTGKLITDRTYYHVSVLTYREADYNRAEENIEGVFDYSTSYSRHGLVDAKGNVLTDAIYYALSALDAHTIRARISFESGDDDEVLLNTKGQVIGHAQ